MKIKTFTTEDLAGAKAALKAAFARPDSDEAFNEWNFAERVLSSDGYVPELCLVARVQSQVVGYNILTVAAIGGSRGLALGPLGVHPDHQGQGVGSALVQESIRRAQAAGHPWIALLGGQYYTRFGFEPALPQGITVTDRDFDNAHLWILFLDPASRGHVSGRLTYCSAFYDETGNLL